MTCINILAEMSFWPPFECAKCVLRRARFRGCLDEKCVTLETSYKQQGNLNTILLEFIGKSLIASLWTDPYLRLSGWGNEEGISTLSILVGAAIVNRRRGVTNRGQRLRG